MAHPLGYKFEDKEHALERMDPTILQKSNSR